jgi:hypothetical protein
MLTPHRTLRKDFFFKNSVEQRFVKTNDSKVSFLSQSLRLLLGCCPATGRPKRQ